MQNAQKVQRETKRQPTSDMFEMLSPEQVAAALGVALKTLQGWRSTGRHGLAFIKVGRRVMYRKSDVEEFINRRMHTQTPGTSYENYDNDEF